VKKYTLSILLAYSVGVSAENIELLCAGFIDLDHSRGPSELRSKLIIDTTTGYLNIRNQIGSWASNEALITPADCSIGTTKYSCFQSTGGKQNGDKWSASIVLDRYTLKLKAKVRRTMYDDDDDTIFDKTKYTFEGECKPFSAPKI